MTSPVDPIRRSAHVRRAQRPSSDGALEPDAPEETAPSRALAAITPDVGRTEGAAAFAAHLLGEGQKRGLRGGPETLDTAKAVYNRVEWSGPADRRARKGRIAKTDV